MAKSLRGQVTLVTPSPGSGAGGATNYGSIGRGTSPADLTFDITSSQLATVQFVGSDHDASPQPTVTGDATHNCFISDWTGVDTSYSGIGWITGDGSVTIAMSGEGGMTVQVADNGGHECRDGG